LIMIEITDDSIKYFAAKIKPRLKGIIKKLTSKLDTYLSRKRNVGKNSYIDPSVHVLGWENVRIGENSVIAEDTIVNINFRHKDKIGLIIGDYCFIGRGNFFSPGVLIKIGNYCLTGPDCKYLGSNHIYTSPFVPYISTGVTYDGLIEIGSNCWLGSDVTVLMGKKIGYGSVIGAATVVNQDIPPLSVVVGNPCQIIKRFDMQSQAWVSVKEYSTDSDKYLPSESEYLNILSKTKLNMNALWIASSKLFGDI
ncbi:MAG: acyltransferase, partial [Rhizonema sp. PD38]|nr:acyltransferase [Rhizonema sp. PD38]